MNRKVTICDIARAAGVSACSVSWVLRNHPRSKGMNVNTKQRILEAASLLGYVQNLLAAATRTGQVNTIALIGNFLKIQSFHPSSQIIAGIMTESSARHFGVKIFDENALELSFRQIAENRIDKVISLSVDPLLREKTAILAEKLGTRLIFCYEHGNGKYPAVNTDNREMSAKGVHYLARHGHTRIGLLCVPHLTFHAKDRHAGYLQGMEECSLKVDPAWVSCSGEDEKKIQNILSLPKRRRPTAFMAHSDLIAACAQRAAWKIGLRIPEELSVIGIGDMEVARGAIVPITTFREGYPAMGKMLVHLVLGEKPELVPDEFNVYRTHAELVERESVFPIKNAGGTA